MNIERLDTILKKIKYNKDGWEFRSGVMGDGFFIQIRFDAIDINTGVVQLQSGRKWYISKFMTKSEVVQTAFYACLKAEEHECREQFTYDGEAVFCPHYSIDELHEFSKRSSRDSRA